jgi:hypothetical protein
MGSRYRPVPTSDALASVDDRRPLATTNRQSFTLLSA